MVVGIYVGPQGPLACIKITKSTLHSHSATAEVVTEKLLGGICLTCESLH